jgi:hypothetical protein
VMDELARKVAGRYKAARVRVIEFPSGRITSPEDIDRLSKSDWARMGVHLQTLNVGITKDYPTPEQATRAAEKDGKAWERSQFPGGSTWVLPVILKFDYAVPGEEEPPPTEYYGVYEKFLSPS